MDKGSRNLLIRNIDNDMSEKKASKIGFLKAVFQSNPFRSCLYHKDLCLKNIWAKMQWWKYLPDDFTVLPIIHLSPDSKFTHT